MRSKRRANSWDGFARRSAPRGKEALDDLAKQPDDTLTQDMLKLQIQKFLRDNPQLVGELQALLPTAATPTNQQNQNVSGDNAKAAQVWGNNNSVSNG